MTAPLAKAAQGELFWDAFALMLLHSQGEKLPSISGLLCWCTTARSKNEDWAQILHLYYVLGMQLTFLPKMA